VAALEGVEHDTELERHLGELARHERLGLLVAGPEPAPKNLAAHQTLGVTETAMRHFARYLELAPDGPMAPTAREILSYLD